MTKGQPKIIIKKVSPYPIDIQLVAPSGATAAKILKLTKVGLMIASPTVMAVGQHFNVNFSLPVSRFNIMADVVVVKAYSRHGGELGINKNHHLVEVHFRSITNKQEEEIQRFLTAIKQV